MKGILHKTGRAIFIGSLTLIAFVLATLWAFFAWLLLIIAFAYVADFGLGSSLFRNLSNYGFISLIGFVSLLTGFAFSKQILYSSTNKEPDTWSDQSHKELFNLFFIMIAIVLLITMILSPIIILTGQALRWLREGYWTSLPTGNFCCQEWAGLASLPISLTLPIFILIIALIINAFTDTE